MLLNTLPLIMLSISMTLITAPTPLTLGMWVLLLAMYITSYTSSFMSSWLSMAIFLIYIGGLMVMFAYFLAIQPNQHLYFVPTLSLMIMSLMYLFLISPTYMPTNQLFLESFTSMSFIMSNTNMPITLFLASVLFLVLIMVVKITAVASGPLRPFQ